MLTFSLVKILENYPQIRLATAADSEKLMKFFADSAMDTSDLQLTYERSPDFFTFLKYGYDEVFIFVSDDGEGSYKGVASISVREGYVNGKLSRIAYLSDLRIDFKKQNRRFAVEWKNCVGEIIDSIKEIPELRCDYIITVIMGNNKIAKNSLVNRPRNTFHYEFHRRYQMFNILQTFGKLNKDKSIKVSRCSNRSEILDYLESKFKEKQFGYTRKFIDRAFSTWHDLSENNFLKVEKEGKIIGMCAAWNPSPVKKIVITKFPALINILNMFLNLLTKAPKEGDELEVQYLNFLNVDNENALYAMIDFLKAEGVFKKYHMLSFADYDDWSLREGIKLAVTDSTPIDFFQVVSKKHMDEIVKIDQIPGFEMSMV